LFASVYDAAPGKGFGSFPDPVPPLGADDKWGYHEFSAGQFVLMPTKAQSEYIFSIYNNPPNVDFQATMEQSFLRYAYRDNGPFPWVRLSQIYNTQWPRAIDMRASKIVHEKSWSGGPLNVKELADKWYKGWGDVQGFLARMRGLEYYKEHQRS
jgi:alpha-N-acetylglucosamine transferase